MAQLNKKCLCDGTKFSYCPDCSRADALKPSWASEFCSEECMILWTTLTKFGMNALTKSEAKSIISELDLKPIETYAPCVQRDYAKVMVKEKKSNKNVKKIEPTVVVEQQEEVVLPVVSDDKIENIEFMTIEETSHAVVIQENE